MGKSTHTRSPKHINGGERSTNQFSKCLVSLVVHKGRGNENRDGLVSLLDKNTMRRPHRQVWNHAVHTGVPRRGARVAAVGRSCAEPMRRGHPTACCLRIDASGGARVAPLSSPFTHMHTYNICPCTHVYMHAYGLAATTQKSRSKHLEHLNI